MPGGRRVRGGPAASWRQRCPPVGGGSRAPWRQPGRPRRAAQCPAGAGGGGGGGACRAGGPGTCATAAPPHGRVRPPCGGGGPAGLRAQAGKQLRLEERRREATFPRGSPPAAECSRVPRGAAGRPSGTGGLAEMRGCRPRAGPGGARRVRPHHWGPGKNALSWGISEVQTPCRVTSVRTPLIS